MPLVGIQTITDLSPNPHADFGASMCEFDGVLVVGAPRAQVGGAPGAGHVVMVKLP